VYGAHSYTRGPHGVVAAVAAKSDVVAVVVAGASALDSVATGAAAPAGGAPPDGAAAGAAALAPAVAAVAAPRATHGRAALFVLSLVVLGARVVRYAAATSRVPSVPVADQGRQRFPFSYSCYLR